ncbi:MAG: hypothetical protein HZA49_00005, partial [Planctomycetes bacterium]|nr:hypothetical protein [Planctomycetota bacterium]
RSFEDNLSGFVRFWRNMGRPNGDILYILLIWDDKEQDRQSTADTVGLSSRESLRKLIARLAKTYRKNTISASPNL